MDTTESAAAPECVRNLLDKAGVTPDMVRSVNWYIVAMPEWHQPPMYRVEVVMDDGTERIGWASPSSDVLTTMEIGVAE
jgi:hypothetical protein